MNRAHNSGWRALVGGGGARRRQRWLPVMMLALAGSVLVPRASAQPLRKSPHETTSKLIDGDRITIVYGRPYTTDPTTGAVRKIWGGLVPYGKIWRVGADEATLLITQKTIELGGLNVPAGAYTLFFIADAEGAAKLIVNKEIGQWGIDPYHPLNELGRVDLQKQALPLPVNQFTIAIENGGRGGVLKLAWERTQYSVPFKVIKAPPAATR